MSKEAMTKAIKALKKCHYYMIDAGWANESINDAFTAYKALEAALAEQQAQQRTEELLEIFKDVDQCGPLLGMGQPAPVQQEPVAVMQLYESGWDLVEDVDLDWLHTLPFGTKLYTSPQPAQQEPVQLAATITITQRGSTRTIDNHFEDCVRDWPDGEYKLYTSPPAQRKPLTDERIYDMYNEPRSDAEMVEFARAIEAAHGIKENT